MASPSEASLRWRLLRHHLLPRTGCSNKEELTKISRRPTGHFGLITVQKINYCEASFTEEGWQNEELGIFLVKYTLPASPVIELYLLQRREDEACLSDFAYAKKHQIDMTGLVGLWPAEEVLTHFCVSNPSLFRNKRVLELGSGYGLGGLAIAACTDAAEVVLTDGNPQVIEYVKANIRRNSKAFGTTKVTACVLHWCDNVPSTFEQCFDIVIAADCTFFRASHTALARSVKDLMKRCSASQALFFNPQRDGSLNCFLQTAKSMKLNVDLKEQYDASLWSLHQDLVKGDVPGWCNYDTDHCYPLLATLMHSNTDLA